MTSGFSIARKFPLNGLYLLAASMFVSYLCLEKIGEVTVKTYYQISSSATGTVVLRKRKIAKALRWWLRENGIVFDYTFYTS